MILTLTELTKTMVVVIDVLFICWFSLLLDPCFLHPILSGVSRHVHTWAGYLHWGWGGAVYLVAS